MCVCVCARVCVHILSSDLGSDDRCLPSIDLLPAPPALRLLRPPLRPVKFIYLRKKATLNVFLNIQSLSEHSFTR